MPHSLSMKKSSHSKEVSHGLIEANRNNFNCTFLKKLLILFFYVILGKFMQLPVNRIRQIINLDSASQMISKEALLVISKATEAFVQDLGGVCGQIAKT